MKMRRKAPTKNTNISTAVPQGSILAPLLCIIYINDFAQYSPTFNFIMYADDTTPSNTLHYFVHYKQFKCSISNRHRTKNIMSCSN